MSNLTEATKAPQTEFRTPAEHIRYAKAVSETLGDIADVTSVEVDDWSDFSSFSVLVFPKGDNTSEGYFMPDGESCADGCKHYAITRLVARLRTKLKETPRLHDISIEAPPLELRRYAVNKVRYRDVLGYARNYVRVSFTVT